MEMQCSEKLHTSSTKLMIGYVSVTNPRPYIIPWVAIRPGRVAANEPANNPRRQRGKPSQICWRWYFGKRFVTAAASGAPR